MSFPFFESGKTCVVTMGRNWQWAHIKGLAIMKWSPVQIDLPMWALVMVLFHVWLKVKWQCCSSGQFCWAMPFRACLNCPTFHRVWAPKWRGAGISFLRSRAQMVGTLQPYSPATV
jgi:hypothetical protein